jgi:hypothetical protein
MDTKREIREEKDEKIAQLERLLIELRKHNSKVLQLLQ